MTKKKNIIFDCDPGDDDVIALLMALAFPEHLNILGITTVCGNATVEHTFQNARSVCTLVGRDDVPVYRGNSVPLFKKPQYAAHMHGDNGLGGVVLPPGKGPLHTQHAVDFIISTLLTYPEKVTLAVTGAMTNVALALIKNPSIVENIDQIVMMGGARREGGNITPCAEFNMYVDPHAARKVLESLHSIVMVPLDVTHQVFFTHQTLDMYRKMGTVVGDLIVQITHHSMEAEMRHQGHPGRSIHDACVTTYLLNPQLFTGKKRFVTVETESPLTLGQTVVGLYASHFPDKQPNCLFLESVEAQGVLDLIFYSLQKHKGVSPRVSKTEERENH